MGVKGNNLVIKYPMSLSEWDYKKNAPQIPENFTFGSHEKAWWICSECGMSYLSTIKDKVKHSTSTCPACSRRIGAKKRIGNGALKIAAETRIKNKLNNGEAVALLHPELLNIWDNEKNGELTLYSVTSGSHVEAYWKCKQGHSYKRIIREQVKGKECPICSNRTLGIGCNDLATVRPDIAKEWNYEKNNTLTPDRIVYGSAAKVWWICDEGHEWEAKVYERTARGMGCPYCANLKIQIGDNDFAHLYPEMAEEWDYELNFPYKPEQFSTGSSYRANWVCKKGHKWNAVIGTRVTDNTGCPVCFRERRTSFPEQAVFFYLSKYFNNVLGRSNYLGVEADIIIEDIKTIIEYDGVYWHKEKATRDNVKDQTFFDKGYKVIRLREKGLQNTNLAKCINVENAGSMESLEKAICELLKYLNITEPDVDIRRDNEIIYDRFVSVQKDNSIAKRYPDLLADWDFDENQVAPDYVAAYSRMRVHWKCHKCGHKWTTYASSRVKTHTDCPKCGEKHLVKRSPKYKVKNIDTGEVFNSVYEAADSCNGSIKCIYNCCGGRKKTAYGYHWEYLEK